MIDYMIEPEEKDDIVGTCCMYGQELYSIDEIIKHNRELYCDYDCLRSEIGTFEIEVTEDICCSFCGELIYAGEDAITDLDGSVFCDKSCVFGGYDIEEVYGYDM